jgi:hypothetical protein
MGNAWADVAIGDDLAHQPAHCSARGLCDFSTGQCTCQEGFEGSSCSRSEHGGEIEAVVRFRVQCWGRPPLSRLPPHSPHDAAPFFPAVSCPNDCSGHGQCQSMKYHATLLDKGSEGLQPASYYYSYADNWDANMIYGCTCDAGFTGPDCSVWECPSGDDPMTTGQSDDIQLIRCDLAPGSYTSNTFTFSFLGAVSAPFAGNADVNTVAAALQALPTITSATVTYTPGFTTFCDDSSIAWPSVPASASGRVG